MLCLIPQVGRLNIARNEKQRKKLAELEAQLVLASPNLPFRISKRAGSVHTFLISSEYERDQWGEAIQVLQVKKEFRVLIQQLNKNIQVVKYMCNSNGTVICITFIMDQDEQLSFYIFSRVDIALVFPS